jgi:hypothetical protein
MREDRKRKKLLEYLRCAANEIGETLQLEETPKLKYCADEINRLDMTIKEKTIAGLKANRKLEAKYLRALNKARDMIAEIIVRDPEAGEFCSALLDRVRTLTVTTLEEVDKRVSEVTDILKRVSVITDIQEARALKILEFTQVVDDWVLSVSHETADREIIGFLQAARDRLHLALNIAATSIESTAGVQADKALLH